MSPRRRLEKHGVVERTEESAPKRWAGVLSSKVSSAFLLGHFLRLQNGAETLALPAAGKLGGPEEALKMGALWKVTRCVHFLKASFLLAGRFWTG